MKAPGWDSVGGFCLLAVVVDILVWVVVIWLCLVYLS